MSMVAPEIITASNLRITSKARALGYGITLVLFGLFEVLAFGRTSTALHTTIQFAYDSAMVVPELSSLVGVVVLIVGLGLVALGVGPRFAPERFGGWARWSKLQLFIGGVGVLLMLWPISLWMGVNQDGQLRDWTVDVAYFCITLGVVSIAAGAVLIWRRFDRAAPILLYCGIVVFILAFLVWAARYAVAPAPPLTLTGVLWGMMLFSTFLILGAVSGTIGERSGVVNIAIEGQFIAGAMVGFMVADVMHNTGVGQIVALVTAAISGAVFATILSVMANRYRANQIIVGVLLVSFATAIAQFIQGQVLTTDAVYQNTPVLPVWALPVVSRIPVIGPVLFDQNCFVYLTIALVVLWHFLLFKTRWGLRVRSVGEKPVASETVGVSVFGARYQAVILAGLVAGLGGAAFTVAAGNQFTWELTSGYGYVALAIMILGRWRPYGAMAAALMFGFTDSLSGALGVFSQQIVIPDAFISALPYMVTIVVVSGLVGKIRPPAADGVPFVRR